MDERNFEGYWWRTDRPEQKVPGRLKLTLQEHVLTLIGSLASPEEFFAAKANSYPLIHGLTTDGKELTLADCLGAGGTFGTGVPTERVVPRVILLGSHVEHGLQQTWTRAFLSFAHLEEWLAQPVVNATPTLDDSGSCRLHDYVL